MRYAMRERQDGSFLGSGRTFQGKRLMTRRAHFHGSCARAFPAPQAAPGFLPFFSSVQISVTIRTKSEIRTTPDRFAGWLRRGPTCKLKRQTPTTFVRDTDTGSVPAWGAPLRCALFFGRSEPERPNRTIFRSAFVRIAAGRRPGAADVARFRPTPVSPNGARRHFWCFQYNHRPRDYREKQTESELSVPTPTAVHAPCIALSRRSRNRHHAHAEARPVTEAYLARARQLAQSS